MIRSRGGLKELHLRPIQRRRALSPPPRGAGIEFQSHCEHQGREEAMGLRGGRKTVREGRFAVIRTWGAGQRDCLQSCIV
ncbi:hypothetical protein TNIN_492131 [Trichonephila inaurata madagascariensis]|uniref:Uncharacterized protein n=1 Tax=Trichonephila inaurata madagascariensis TaxID=2747483 RepID=A0A8X6MLJ0_9ARAC|nr:hypothetical protein TNIN_492131 [Trichonephila inaurata madagascariensis]